MLILDANMVLMMIGFLAPTRIHWGSCVLIEIIKVKPKFIECIQWHQCCGNNVGCTKRCVVEIFPFKI